MLETQRWSLGVEYLGAAYCGWQRQLLQPSLQAHVESALTSIAATPINITAAGRTDTGVHASLQVVHFDASVDRDAMSWVRGGNQHLPPDISIRWAKPVSNEFHARFSALSRRYVYLLAAQPYRPGLHATRVGWTHWPQDVARIHAALPAIVGTHDFGAFRAAECQAKSPVKTIYAASATASNGMIRFDFHANAFLHHMIRNIVGALVYVGNSRQPIDWLATLLQGRDRTKAAPTFSPNGLYLAGIEYDRKFDLPEAFVDPRL
jgi:tRNA pseudouridine38-40 synthase